MSIILHYKRSSTQIIQKLLSNVNKIYIGHFRGMLGVVVEGERKKTHNEKVKIALEPI